MERRLGTRRSLLALTQSRWVARKIEAANPNLSIELVGIETQGDRIQDVPLSKIEGKEFFVAELDQALIQGAVDLNVHSLKDLSLERPKEFALGAVPEREDPHDVVLFAEDIQERIDSKKTIRIGTSSPRRLENLPNFLKQALPGSPSLQMVDVRGNVNTRLGRLFETGERQLDGIILALAGLNRICADPESRPKISMHLERVRWMVPPLEENPTAPGQGALAVECRANDQVTLDALRKIHHSPTAEIINAERQVLHQYGGGCHQRFGVTRLDVENLGSLQFTRGKSLQNEILNEMTWSAASTLPSPQAVHRKVSAWDGGQDRRGLFDTDYFEINPPPQMARNQAVFVAHSRAWPRNWSSQLARVWTSGVKSWFRLAKQGIWVEGCTEQMGVSFLQRALNQPALNLPPLNQWTILTHEGASPDWAGSHVIPTYAIEENPSPQMIEKIKNSTHFFWMSGSQFEAASEWVQPGAIHACGPGKTASRLKQYGIKELLIFPKIEEWRKWLKM